MGATWNPRFGFYLPIKNSKHSKSISRLNRDDYAGYKGPIPLIEVWSDEDELTLSEKIDLLLEFGTKSTRIRKPRFGDMVVEVDYNNLSLYRHYIYHKGFTSDTDKYEYSTIPSKKYPKRYIRPGLASHTFVRSVVLEAQTEDEK